MNTLSIYSVPMWFICHWLMTRSLDFNQMSLVRGRWISHTIFFKHLVNHVSMDCLTSHSYYDIASLSSGSFHSKSLFFVSSIACLTNNFWFSPLGFIWKRFLSSSFFLSRSSLLVSGYQAVLETVARVKTKKNDTKEDKYMLLSH